MPVVMDNKPMTAAVGNLRIYRLPKAIERARSAVSPEGITGYLLCAREQRIGVTGLLFCGEDQGLPDGVAISTSPVQDRAWVEEYELVITMDGVYVIAHRQQENGAFDPLESLH